MIDGPTQTRFWFGSFDKVGLWLGKCMELNYDLWIEELWSSSLWRLLLRLGFREPLVVLRREPLSLGEEAATSSWWSLWLSLPLACQRERAAD